MTSPPNQEKSPLEENLDKWVASLTRLPSTLSSRRYQRLILIFLLFAVSYWLVEKYLGEVLKGWISKNNSSSESRTITSPSGNADSLFLTPSVAVPQIADSSIATSLPRQAASTPQPSRPLLPKPTDVERSDAQSPPLPQRHAVPLPVSMRNSAALNGIQGIWRSATDPDCLHSIHIEIQNNLLLWKNPGIQDPQAFSLIAADISAIQVKSPEGKTATFDVHTKSFRFKPEDFDSSVEYVRCL
jgi:hypothetical protein